MAKYVADYVDDLRAHGASKMSTETIHPALVLTGVVGTLREQKRASGTMATDMTEMLTLSKLVGRVFPVSKRKDSPPGPVVVGRSSENDVSIADYSISNRHCFFVIGGREPQLIDCGSTNGTLINGTKAPAKQPVSLKGGETVVIGRFAFLFFRPVGFLEYLVQQQQG